jgi:hypothetical protein
LNYLENLFVSYNKKEQSFQMIFSVAPIIADKADCSVNALSRIGFEVCSYCFATIKLWSIAPSLSERTHEIVRL